MRNQPLRDSRTSKVVPKSTSISSPGSGGGRAPTIGAVGDGPVRTLSPRGSGSEDHPEKLQAFAAVAPEAGCAEAAADDEELLPSASFACSAVTVPLLQADRIKAGRSSGSGKRAVIPGSLS